MSNHTACVCSSGSRIYMRIWLPYVSTSQCSPLTSTSTEVADDRLCLQDSIKHEAMTSTQQSFKQACVCWPTILSSSPTRPRPRDRTQNISSCSLFIPSAEYIESLVAFAVRINIDVCFHPYLCCDVQHFSMNRRRQGNHGKSPPVYE